jgi:hydrogenase nickel incorporation protein HypB
MEIKVMKNIMTANEKLAWENRQFLTGNGTVAFNIMASPGAGKTSIIYRIIETLKDRISFGVIEGDIASRIDADKLETLGIPVEQINTNGGCHLDAAMIHGLIRERFAFKGVLFIENVGNLVCPSSFDLGENRKIVIASVPEGHDKPFKYVSMFAAADLVILNKTDLLPYIDFNMELFIKGVRAVNEKVPIIQVSCSTGEGFEELTAWIAANAAQTEQQ